MSVSAVVVTYNAADVIADCLGDLLTAVDEVIVVDNASSDGTPDLIRRDFPAAQLIEAGANLGYGAGNNLGVRHASGDVLLIVNPDVRLTRDALAALVTYLHEHPDVGIVGPRTVDESGLVSMTARPAYTPGRVLAVYLGLANRWPRLAYGDLPQRLRTAQAPLDVDWLQGACLALPRRVYEALGGFDESFFLFAEDVDLCQRAGQAGWRVVYLPSACVTHHGSSSVKRAHHISTRSYHISPLHYFRKRGQRGAVWLLKAGFVVELAIKATRRTWQGRHDPAAHAEARIYRQTIRDVIRDRATN